MSISSIIDAIVEDDCRTVTSLLRADPSIASMQFRQAQLYWGKIFSLDLCRRHPFAFGSSRLPGRNRRFTACRRADPNSRLNHRRSGPLHYATDTNHASAAWDASRQVATIKRLLKAGADINAQDKNGATPLHRAVRTRGAEAVRCLLRAGCDPFIRNNPGSTPFHLAVQNTGRGGSGSENAKSAQRQIILEFLSFGLGPDLKDSNGKTVREWARTDWIREMIGA